MSRSKSPVLPAAELEALRGDAAVALLTELVKRRSVTPDDAGCQDMLAARLAAAGFRCESMPFGKVSNLWARIGSKSPLLCFAGHTDVVPAGSPGDWHSAPFDPVIRGGDLYGRGTADMKSGLAAMVVAAERFVAAYPGFRGSLAFLITSDEEGRARDGTLKVIETLQARDEKIDWCVLGEPSSDKRLGDVIRVGRRGSLSGLLTVNGVQGHVAYPQLADNPISRFAPSLAELCTTVWDQGNRHFPPTSFQFVQLESGSGAPNVTPAQLTARFNFRYSTVWDQQRLQDRVTSILDDADMDYELRWHLSGEPFLTKPGKLIDATMQAISELAHLTPQCSTGGGTSDGRFIAPTGAEVVELGPVNASIHKVDEHVRLADVPQLARMYQRIMELLLA